MDTDTKESSNIEVSIKGLPPNGFSTPNLASLKSKANNLSRMSEKGLVNELTGSANIIRDNGQINLSASSSAQYKLNPDGVAMEVSTESNTYSVRKKFSINELIVNEHKLNPDLYELTDFKQRTLLPGQDVIIGNLCVYGSVLVKAWEPNLKRYMLIRRPVRVPLFSNQLNTPTINPGLNINDPFQDSTSILGQSSSGYQVNGEIKDKNSLIGKEGVDRSNPINSNNNAQK